MADNRRGAVLVGIPVARMVMVSFALSAAILGGYGNVWGAVAGGLLLGVLESLAAGFVSSAYKDALAFLILLCELWVRPSGLFGQRTMHRV